MFDYESQDISGRDVLRDLDGPLRDLDGPLRDCGGDGGSVRSMR